MVANRHRFVIALAAVVVLALFAPADASAHNVSKRDAAFVVANQGRAIVPFLYLGAKHMVTGYDHLLFHGFGLATKPQQFALAQNGLVANIVSFNVGVEIGQFLALTAVFIGLSYWRTRAGFLRHAFVTNTLLMVGGFMLVGYQLTGYVVTP